MSVNLVLCLLVCGGAVVELALSLFSLGVSLLVIGSALFLVISHGFSEAVRRSSCWCIFTVYTSRAAGGFCARFVTPEHVVVAASIAISQIATA